MGLGVSPAIRFQPRERPKRLGKSLPLKRGALSRCRDGSLDVFWQEMNAFCTVFHTQRADWARHLLVTD